MWLSVLLMVVGICLGCYCYLFMLYGYAYFARFVGLFYLINEVWFGVNWFYLFWVLLDLIWFCLIWMLIWILCGVIVVFKFRGFGLAWFDLVVLVYLFYLYFRFICLWLWLFSWFVWIGWRFVFAGCGCLFGCVTCLCGLRLACWFPTRFAACYCLRLYVLFGGFWRLVLFCVAVSCFAFTDI